MLTTTVKVVGLFLLGILKHTEFVTVIPVAILNNISRACFGFLEEDPFALNFADPIVNTIFDWQHVGDVINF